MLRDAFRDTHDQTNLCVDRLLNTSSSERGRDEDGARVRACLLHGVADAREDGLAQMLCTSLLGIGATNDIRSILDRLCRVEGALSASEALKYDLGVPCLMSAQIPSHVQRSGSCVAAFLVATPYAPFTLRFLFVEAYPLGAAME